MTRTQAYLELVLNKKRIFRLSFLVVLIGIILTELNKDSSVSEVFISFVVISAGNVILYLLSHVDDEWNRDHIVPTVYLLALIMFFGTMCFGTVQLFTGVVTGILSVLLVLKVIYFKKYPYESSYIKNPTQSI